LRYGLFSGRATRLFDTDRDENQNAETTDFADFVLINEM